MNDWDRSIIGAATREELLSIREAVNATASSVAELAGAFKQRSLDDGERWREVRADISLLHSRINALPTIIDAKVSTAVKEHADACAKETRPAVQAFQDAEAARRYAVRTLRPVLALFVVVALAAIGILFGLGFEEAAGIVGTVFGAATPFAVLFLNRK